MADIVTTIKQHFPRQRIVILGDLVADQFLNGTIARVSREAPVFILRHDETITVPGAAGNAAVNAASLGAVPVLVGCVGTDYNGDMLVASLESSGVDCRFVRCTDHLKTTTKVRVLAGQHYAARQQVIRIDYENSHQLTEDVRADLRKAFASAAQDAGAIVVSDYGYGVVFPELYSDALAISRSRDIPLIVDSRYRLQDLADATTATPNREEVEQILGPNFTGDQCAGLRERLGLKALVVTNGNQGMNLFESGKPELRIPAVGSLEPVDVTGAGDTVIAAYALGLASGLDFAESATVANHAGGVVVMKKGTASVTSDELIQSLDNSGNVLSSHAE